MNSRCIVYSVFITTTNNISLLLSWTPVPALGCSTRIWDVRASGYGPWQWISRNVDFSNRSFQVCQTQWRELHAVVPTHAVVTPGTLSLADRHRRWTLPRETLRHTAYGTDSAHSLEGNEEGMAQLVAEGSRSSGVDEGSGGAIAMASYCANEDCKGDVGCMEEDVCHQPAEKEWDCIPCQEEAGFWERWLQKEGRPRPEARRWVPLLSQQRALDQQVPKAWGGWEEEQRRFSQPRCFQPAGSWSLRNWSGVYGWGNQYKGFWYQHQINSRLWRHLPHVLWPSPHTRQHLPPSPYPLVITVTFLLQAVVPSASRLGCWMGTAL